MSDLQARNAKAMMSHIEALNARLDEVLKTIVLQNAKIASLTNELASLKKKQVLDAIQRQLEEKGHGGTA